MSKQEALAILASCAEKVTKEINEESNEFVKAGCRFSLNSLEYAMAIIKQID